MEWSQKFVEIYISQLLTLGVIQQLRGQEGGEGGSAKSPRFSTQGGGGSQVVHVDKKF